MNKTIFQLRITVASLSIVGLGVTALSGQDIPVSRPITIVKDIPNIVSRPVTISRDIPNVVSRPFTLAFCPAGEDVPGEPDCNDNGSQDVCDIANCTGDPACDDCNSNDVPDECDITNGTSLDNDANGIPDECEFCEANEEVKIHPSIVNPPNGFGAHVSISGNRLLASAGGDDCEDGSRNCGSVFVFRLDGSIWVEEDRLTADDAQAWDFFGTTISQSGDRIIIGSSGGLNASEAFGTAYIFRRDDNGTPLDPSDDFWIQEAKLNASDEIVGDGYGFPVSISGDWAVVGARFDDDAGTSSGSAYVFRREDNNTPSEPSDDFWGQEAKLTADDAFGGDLFGWSVAISMDRVIVGARGAACGDVFNRCGAAYVFRREGSSWVQEAKLLALDKAVGDAFGVSVSISGNRAIVGAYRDDDACPTDPNCDSGSVYVFRRQGTSWLQEAKITASDAAVGDLFSWNVSMHGDRAIVGTRIGLSVNDFGAGYVYQRDDSGTPLDPSDDVWTQIAILTASDAALGDLFAWDVSISGDWAIVGAGRDDDGCPTPNCNTGSAYVFDLSDLCPVCGDGVCTPSEPCTCPEDCGAPPSSEVPGSTCADGEDNDCDGSTDCDDPDCRDEADCADIQDCNDNGIVDSDEPLKKRAFCILPCTTPCSNGTEWSLRVDWEGAGPNFTELNCPAVPVSGSTRADMAQGLADCINGVACPSITAAHIAPPCLLVTAPAAPVRICVGAAGLTPDCCASAGLACSFNPDLVEIVLSERDCNGNGIDDAIDIFVGTSEDDNENGILDECEELIPTVSQWGMILMALLLLTGIKIKFGWRRSARA